MGVDYSHLIKITGSPEPLRKIRSKKRIIHRLFSLIRTQKECILYI